MKGIINVCCELWKRRPSIINCVHNQCNCNGVRSGMTAQCCHQSHICTENLMPKITLRLWADFLTCTCDILWLFHFIHHSVEVLVQIWVVSTSYLVVSLSPLTLVSIRTTVCASLRIYCARRSAFQALPLSAATAA